MGRPAKTLKNVEIKKPIKVEEFKEVIEELEEKEVKKPRIMIDKDAL